VLGRAAKEALGNVYHGHYLHSVPHVDTPAEVARTLPWDTACACRRARVGVTPRAYVAFVLGADTLSVVSNTYPDADHGWRADSELAAQTVAVGLRRWIHDTLTAQIHSGYRSEWGFTYIVGQGGNDTRVLAYTLMPTVWRDTVVYAIEYTPAAFAQLLGGAFDAPELLPWTFIRGRPTRTLLTGEVLDASGHRLFASDPEHVWQLDARQGFSESYGGMAAHLEIRPELANELVIGGLPRSRLPFLLTLLALAAALSVVAVMQLRREGELAQLRADFVANVSHELRTPLAQIRLDLDTLRLGRYDTPELHTSILERIDRETRRLTYLAENVLRLSRHGRGSGSVVREPTDVPHEAAQIVEEFRPLAFARRAVIETTLERTPIIALEADAFRQVLVNLLDNAVKYGPPGQTVRVSVYAVGNAVRVTVADQGPGVPPDERDRVWQPFMRGSTSVRRGVGGSGIGLTIVRQVVERHGGRTWVGDADGGGAAFAVEFPLPPAIRTVSGIEATNGVAPLDRSAAAGSGANDPPDAATNAEAQAGHHPRESSDTLSGV
jgi:signal transduction histidine kinase